jgi:hypothetical protein
MFMVVSFPWPVTSAHPELASISRRAKSLPPAPPVTEIARPNAEQSERVGRTLTPLKV